MGCSSCPFSSSFRLLFPPCPSWLFQPCLSCEHRFYIARAQKLIYSIYVFFWFWFGRCTANLFLAFHWPLLLALGGLFVGELELDEDLSGCLQIWQFQVIVLFKHVLKEILTHVKMGMIWIDSAKNGKRSTIDNDMSTYGTVCICRITMYLYRLVFGPVKLGVLAGCSLWKHLDKQRWFRDLSTTWSCKEEATTQKPVGCSNISYTVMLFLKNVTDIFIYLYLDHLYAAWCKEAMTGTPRGGRFEYGTCLETAEVGMETRGIVTV